MTNKFEPGAPVALSDFLKRAEPALAGGRNPEFLKPAEPALAKRERARAWRAANPERVAEHDRRRAEKRAANRKPRRKREATGGALARRIAAAMEPRCWYGRPDLARLSGVARKPCDAIVVRMVRAGWIEQGEDPNWRVHVYRKGLGIEKQAARACRYLFKLTPHGETVRREVRALD